MKNHCLPADHLALPVSPVETKNHTLLWMHADALSSLVKDVAQGSAVQAARLRRRTMKLLGNPRRSHSQKQSMDWPTGKRPPKVMPGCGRMWVGKTQVLA